MPSVKRSRRRSVARKLKYLDITIVEETMKKLGYWSPLNKLIAIKKKQAWVGKHITLMHEFLHATDDAMIAAKITKARISHKWIESAAGNLLLMLVVADLYKGVSQAEMMRFYRRLR